MQVPKIKKNLSSFLLEEDGKITKQSVLVLGSILAASAFASIIQPEVDAITIRGTHSHSHTSHSSHGSHGSHASHASHASY